MIYILHLFIFISFFSLSNNKNKEEPDILFEEEISCLFSERFVTILRYHIFTRQLLLYLI